MSSNDKETQWIKNNTIRFEDDIIEQLKDPEFQKEWLNQTILDYISDGDYNAFYRCLEYAIKARGTVKEFAEQAGINRSNLIDLLHGKTKTSPNFTTITKILSGLGYTLTVDRLPSQSA